MKLMSEITINVKKGFLPHLTNELYKRNCEVQSVKMMESEGDFDLFHLDVVYSGLEVLQEFVRKIEKHSENFKIRSVKNVMEDAITGGLLRVSGKMTIETEADYELRVLGASELIQSKIKQGLKGREYVGISRNVGIIQGVKNREERDIPALFGNYVQEEKDAAVISRFCGLNPYPLLIGFDHIEDFIRTLQRLEQTFTLIRIAGIDDVFEAVQFEQLYSSLDTPILSRSYDEIPLLLLTAVLTLTGKSRGGISDCNVGLIGIDVPSQRLTKLLLSMGFARILGYDHNEKIMMSFEKEGGLATTPDNILSNTDIILLLKRQYTEEEFNKIRPGQMIISLLGEDEVDEKIVQERGVKRIITRDQMDETVLLPGLVNAMISAGLRFLDDDRIITVARMVAGLQQGGDVLPSLFSDLHERIRESLSEPFSARK